MIDAALPMSLEVVMELGNAVETDSTEAEVMAVGSWEVIDTLGAVTEAVMGGVMTVLSGSYA